MKTKTPYVKLLHPILVFFLLACANSAYSQILFQTSFEGSNPFAGMSNSQSCCSYSVTGSTLHARDGVQSYRAEVRTTDPPVSSGYRAELVLPNISDQGDMWYGWSMYFQGNTNNGNSWGGSSGHVVQWHPNNGSGSAELAIYADGGYFDITTNPSGGAGGTHQTTNTQQIIANQWYDIVFHVNWASTGGSVEVWINGQLYFTKNNLNWLPNAYFKFGMNRWLMTNDWVIFYDNLKIGRNVTYNDVAPNASNPPTNQPPTANAGNDITMTLPTNSTTLNGSGTDSDGTIASYAWSRVSGPTTYTLGTPNQASTSLSNLVQGTYVFKLTVTDNAGATATDNVSVVVNPAPNLPPVANAGSNITITLPTNSATLNGSGTDPDGTIASYAWTKVSGPSSYTFGTPNQASTTVSNLVQGTYVFRLTVTDNNGATGTSNVTVTVNAAPPNLPPSANAGNNIVLTLPTNSTTLNGSGTDPDGSIASYAWTRVSGPTTYTLGTPNQASTSLSNLVQGTYVFRLTVTDNNGATGTDDVTVTVNPLPNQPPTANAGNDIVLTLPTNSTTLNGSGTDPDGTIASYAWTRVSGPTTYTFGTANQATTTLSNLVQGTYVFRLTVTDNSGATATDNVTVTVNPAPNQPPTANAGNNIVLTLPTNSTTLNGSGTDPDGTIVSYAWTRVSGPTTYTLGTANLASTSLSNLVQGTYVFRLTVTDNSGATAWDEVTITVNAAPPTNQPPVAEAGANITITLPTNSTTLNGNGSTDADGTIVSYAWVRISGPTTYTLGSPNSVTTSLTNLVAGVYVFRLTVTDNNGATGTDNVTVTVNPPANQPPTANAGNNITLTLPVNSTTLNGSGTDADGTIVSYAWTRVSGPATYTLGTANQATTSLSNLVQGTYVFRLTVTDNSGATGTDDITITVNGIANQPPIANAGNNIVLTLPANSTTLNGSGSIDPDGSIVSYAWTKVSGPATYTIANPGSANTALTNLVQGVYIFTLTVTDNNGGTNSDNVVVTVNPASTPVNIAPTANAGSDIIMTLPSNSATLNGSGTDPDGTISSYAWTKLAGPATYTIGSPSSAVTTISNLVQGTYVFRLTVTDNSGATGYDDVTIVVNAALASNQPPTARTDNDIVLVLPVNSTQVHGNTSYDPDGVIASYEWTQVSGPAPATITNGLTAVATVSNLTTGIYTFQLKVTDNGGLSSVKTMKVTVQNQPGAQAAYFNIYPNPSTGIINLKYIENANGKFKITIYDVNRKLMRQQEIDKNQVSITETIDITTFEAGVYFIQIESPGNQRLTKQLVKM